MRTRIGIAVILLLISALPQLACGAGDEDTTARLRELVHRTQEALRQAQADNAELTRAKTDAEQKLAAATKQLESAQSGSKAAQAAQASLQSKVTIAESAQADLTLKLADANDRLSATNTKLGEATKQLAARDAELAQLKQGFAQSQAANASCEDKNMKLYTYGQELLHAYRKKGVWAALSQKDPVLGLKEVDIENVVQEYKIKFANQKVKP